MALFVLRRVLWGIGVVFVTACFAYIGWRWLRRELPENQPWLDKSLTDLRRFFLHADFGTACSFVPGSKSRPCPAIRGLFGRGWQADLWMLFGTIALGTGTGIAAGLWVAAHPRRWHTRGLETLAILGLCAPPFVFGYALLLIFEPTFGVVKLPFLFTVHVYAQPYDDPVAFLRGLLVPWIVAGAPVFAVVLRITRSAVVEAQDEDFMRTAVAKGLLHRQVIFRHGRPLAYAAVFAWMGTASALIVLNVYITESVFSVPGFLYHIKSALRPQGTPGIPQPPDHTLLQAEAVWVAVTIVAVGIISDLLLMAKDPRIRARGRLG